MTTRLAAAIVRLPQVLPIKQVAAWFGVACETVKQIDSRELERRLGPVDLSIVRMISIDDFAIQRGHRNATVVVEVPPKRRPDRGREASPCVLHAARPVVKHRLHQRLQLR
jgi:transposase